MSPNPEKQPQPQLYKVIVAAGTYEGSIAGYEMTLSAAARRPTSQKMENDRDEEDDNDTTMTSNGYSNHETNKLKVVFASPVHDGSVRSLTVAVSSVAGNNTTTTNNNNGLLLLSSGYDEMLKTHDFGKRLSSSGEVRTPADFGTPHCSAFAPPPPVSLLWGLPGDGSAPTTTSTHCLVGFGAAAAPSETGGGSNGGELVTTGGKLIIYKKRDWSIQHVLTGHDGGIATMAVHPTGKLALTGGMQDGKLKVWDLERGRLAFASPSMRKSTTPSAGGAAAGQRKSQYDSIDCIVWNRSGDSYAFSHGSHISVRQVETGKYLLDVELPSKVNQICLLEGPEGLFVAAACNDGSLPLLAVELTASDVPLDDTEKPAIMAIEPVDGPVAGEERFKCIHTLIGYYVVTANSAGVVSVMNLQGAVNMMISPTPTSSSAANRDDSDGDDYDSDDNDETDDDDDSELAVDIVDSVRLGSGSRITCLIAWASPLTKEGTADVPVSKNSKISNPKQEAVVVEAGNQRSEKITLDSASLEKARALVSKAKQIQKRKHDKKHKIKGKAVK